VAKAQKRTRKKDQRRARIEAELRAQQALRRRRMIINLVILGVVAGLIAALIFRSRQDDVDSASPTATPTSSPGASVACGGEKIERPSPPPSFSEAPPMSIDKAKTYIAKMETSCGTIQIQLADDESPQTVNSFVFLARQGFYDGLIFHRVVKEFAVQGGDPQGTGSGGPGYKVTEAPPPNFKYVKGTVAMAKAGAEPDGTSGSQFFIVPGDGASSLPAQYAVLGKTTDGIDVLDKIQAIPVGGDTGELPVQTVYIVKVTIEES
jgi:peptidyl-prolyl cis-trans isomerase B (cyclophilin B)